MPPFLTRLDPDGYYARLGVDPTAAHAEIVTAFRHKARVLHPDVPKTGNAAAFVAIREAYDVLSSQPRRTAYDRAAREDVPDTIKREEIDTATVRRGTRTAAQNHWPRFSDLPIAGWVGLGAFLCLCVYEAVSHLLAPSATVRADIRPNAAIVAPLSDSAHQAVLYGPKPVRLGGIPNFYVVPAGTPAVLWRLDTGRNALVPLGQLPPFSLVQAVRMVRQTGMLEVLLNDRGGNGFVSADHLTPGNATAARQAYCGYNAGPMPFDGETLERHGSGGGKLDLDSRAVEPAVVKLRNETGTVTLSVFLGPGGHATLQGLPEGTYRPEFAIGELWSRACNSFAAGMRSRRMDEALRLPDDSHLVVAPDGDDAASTEISEQDFERD
jgi:DnaJ domain